MAEYLIQDTTLTSIADAIREKEGSSGTIQVSAFASKIAAISTGTTVQTKSGTFTTGTSGTATVTCGFQPDVVSITLGEYATSSKKYYTVALPFLEYSGKTLDVCLWTGASSSDGECIDICATRTTSGFSITSVVGIDWDWDESTLKNKTFNYVAYKFT